MARSYFLIEAMFAIHKWRLSINDTIVIPGINGGEPRDFARQLTFLGFPRLIKG